MKPYRVKRGSKYIGSFIVVHGGERVNLKTKDASEARRRAALLVKGMWPPEGNETARAVKDSIEGAAEVEPAQVSPPPVPPPLPPAPPLPPPVDHAPDPVSAAAAVNAAAAEGADLDQEAAAVLADTGLDMAEVMEKAPVLLSGIHLWLQGQFCRAGVRAAKGRWPQMVTLPETDSLRLMIGKLWTAKLKELNLDLDNIGPGWWLLILSGVSAFAQVGAMIQAMAEEDARKAQAAN